MPEPHGAVELPEQVEAAIAGSIEAAEGQVHTEDIECPICTNPALGCAVETPCEHLFHRHCLEDALARAQRCPSCMADLPAGGVICSEPTLTLKVVLNKTLVNCPQGCGAEPMWFSRLAGHVQAGGDCPRTPVRCQNEGCGVVSERRDAGRHAAECPQRLEPCSACGQGVRASNLQDHRLQACEYRLHKCEYCNEALLFRNLPLHLRSECTAPVPMKHYARLREAWATALERQPESVRRAQAQLHREAHTAAADASRDRAQAELARFERRYAARREREHSDAARVRTTVLVRRLTLCCMVPFARLAICFALHSNAVDVKWPDSMTVDAKWPDRVSVDVNWPPGVDQSLAFGFTTFDLQVWLFLLVAAVMF